MIYSFSGHRLHKIFPTKWAYTDRAIQFLDYFAIRTLQDLDITHKDHCIVGGAHGWDMAVANACYVLQIPYTLVVPHKGQESRWPENVKLSYLNQFDRAREVIILYDKYNDRCMNERDRRMVDDSETLIALMSSAIAGGTRTTVEYANRTRGELFTVNVWPQWTELKKKVPFPLL